MADGYPQFDTAPETEIDRSVEGDRRFDWFQ